MFIILLLKVKNTIQIISYFCQDYYLNNQLLFSVQSQDSRIEKNSKHIGHRFVEEL